ncbi:MAG: phospholipase D family protein [Gammaproteobacteria bacterium]|nr:phospholipase D family protein [Gammaproteobacteria bacterium]
MRERAAARCAAHRRWLLLGVIAAGCAGTVPERPAAAPSAAFTAWQETAIGRAIAPVVAEHPGQSGFALVAGGEQAFDVRRGLALLAERSIDAQYYIWEADTTGRLLAHDLLAAAGRGVRVRVLVDDIHTRGVDFDIAALDAHPNIEIRVFNPFSNREARNLNLVTELTRLNHRMHNKVWLVDGAVALVGGRNIGDDYFGIDTAANFRDLDMVAMGPVVPEVGASFDRYWNSRWALPIDAVADDMPTPAQAAQLQAELTAWAGALTGFPYRDIRDAAGAAAVFTPQLGQLHWGRAQVIVDDPEKMAGSWQGGVAGALAPVVEAARRDVLMEAAYFIATDAGTAMLGKLTQRGVRVRVLTNSLATNDLVPAHAGYTRYREALVRAGVELHEFRPDAAGPRQGWSAGAGASRASLHTKAIVVDGERSFIGSFNLTPRSVELNTEIGIVVDSPALAAAITAFLDSGVDATNAWRLGLRGSGRGSELVWTGTDQGQPVVHDTEPDVGAWRRFTAWLVAILPVEKPL